MITKEQVMPLFLSACPSFAPDWEKYRASNPDEGLLYIDVSELAYHIVALIKSKQTSEFSAVFDVIECLHVEGDDYVREVATIGVLESLQNVASNDGVDPEAFVPWLGIESRRWWRQLNDFWQAKIPYVGATINNG
jgi:hypothetical protein